MIRNEWDGQDRRISRDENDRRHWRDDGGIDRERIIEIQHPQPLHVPSNNKWMAPGVIIPIVLAILAPSGGFIFDLYNRVSAIDYKQTSLSEKITDNKTIVTDLKIQLKEIEQRDQKLEKHISSVEQSVMEMYRQKK